MSNNLVKLDRVRLRNFLSFYEGEVVFDPGLTVITGPNGSGKTSIFHAIKFAFGSNQRENRYPKWSKFIRQGANSSEVELTVQVNGKEQKFKRRIDRDGVPRAYVDGRRVKASEHNAQVEALGLDVDNPLVFMPQERINALREMNPIEVRKLIEEGTGLDVLRDRIAIQQTQLVHDRKRFEDTLSESEMVEREIGLLQKDLDRLKRKRELQSEEIELENELKWAMLDDSHNRIESIKKEIGEKETGLVDIVEKSRNLELEVESEQKESSVLEDSLEKLQREIGNIDARINEEENKLSRVEDDSKKTGLEFRRLDQVLNEENRKKRRIKEELERASQAKEEYMEQQREISESIQVAERELAEVDEALEEFAEWNTRRMNVYGNYKALQTQIENKDILLRSLNERLQREEADLQEIQSKWGHLWTTLEKTDQDELTVRKTTIERELERLTEERFKKTSLAAQLQKEINDLKMKLSESSERVPLAVRELKESISEHRLQSVIGPIIEVLISNSEVSHIVEAVLPEELAFSFLTTDSADFALLERLRNKNEVPAPIILIPARPTRELPDLPNYKGVRDWLWNLVGVDDDLISLLRAAFGDYVVVDTATTASRVASKYGLKVVSQDGYVVIPEEERMTSYPKRVSTGIISTAPLQTKLANRERELARTHADVSKVVTGIDTVSKEREEVLDLIGHITRWGGTWEKRKRLIESIPEIRERVSEVDKDLEDLQKKLEEHERELRELDNTQPPERSKLVGRQAAMRNKHRNLQRELSKAEAGINGIERDEAVRRSEMKNIEEHITMYGERFEELRAEIQESKSESKKILDTIEALRTGREKAEKEIIRNREDLLKVREVIRNVGSRLVELNLRISTSKQEVRQLNRQLSILESERKKLIDDLEGRKRPAIVRDLEEVRKNLIRIRTLLDDYQDVSEVIAHTETKLKDRLSELAIKIKELKEELHEAESAITDIRTQYHNGMNVALEEVEAEVNKILSSVQFEASVRFDLSMRDGEYGVEFKSRIRGEEYKNLSAGSGGERSLVAIGVILALQRFNPAPLYAMDEIDIFLDATNTEMVSRLLHDSSRASQFIVFTPAKSTHLLKHADKRIGVASPGGTEPSVIVESPEFIGQ